MVGVWGPAAGLQVVIFYTTGTRWQERFYEGRVASVKSPALDSWDGERLLQNNLCVRFLDGSSEVCTQHCMPA